MKKVLFLCYDKFPDFGACSTVLSNLCFEGNISRELETHVATIKYLNSEKDYEENKGIIIRRELIEELVLRKYIKRLAGESLFLAVKCFSDKALYDVFQKHGTKYIYNRIARKIVHQIKEIDDGTFDYFIPIVGRYETAYAALEYKKIYNKDLKIILYQIDPCSTNTMFSSKTLEERKELENALYSESDHILLTKIMYEELSGKYPLDIVKKMQVIEFPCVLPELRKIYKPTILRKNKNDIICVFSGSLYKGFRDPEYTLRLFSKLNPNIKLVLAGVDKSQLPIDFRDDVHVVPLGKLSMKESREIENGADFLVNIGNRMLNQVPSKIFEYISMGLPIINICTSALCPTICYTQKYENAINIIENVDQIYGQVELLNRFIINNYGKRSNMEAIESKFEECTPSYCANQIIDMIQFTPCCSIN